MRGNPQMAAIHDLMRELTEAMADYDENMGGDTEGEVPTKMEEVTVAAPNREGLEEGLEMAEDLVGGEEGMHGMDDSGATAELDDDYDTALPEDDMTDEEVDEKLRKVMKM